MELSDTRLSPRILTFLLLTGFLVRIAFIFSHQRPVVSDEREYDELAQSIVTTASYSIGGTSTAYRPVGYPILLSAVYAMFGHHPFVAKLFQAFLDTLTAYFLFLLGAVRSRRAGLIAAVFWLLFPPAILFSNLILTESLSVFLVALFFFLFHKLQPSTPIIHFIICGVILGLAMLVKPTILVFLLLLPAVSATMGLPIRRMVVLASISLAVILPWMTRNLVVLDTFALSTNGGMNLYVGNNPLATGAYSGMFPEELSDTTISELGRNQRSMKLATEYVANHPGKFLLNGIKKVVHVFRSEGDVLIASFADHSLRKIGFKEQYRSVPILVVAVTNISSILLLLLGLGGFLSSPRDRLFWLSAVFIICSLLVNFVFFGGSRFHFLFMPLAALYAAFAATSLIEKRFILPRAGTVFLAAGALALSSLWAYELILIYHAG